MFIRRYFQGNQFTKNIRADGKVVIVTGCNTGIGKETALDLAKRGARVYMACRDENRCEKTRLEIIKESGNDQVLNRPLDLSSMESVRKFAARFLAEETRLDILIHNAGVGGMPRTTTVDGYEMVIAVNHLGPFLLTNLLLDILKKSTPSRIVTVSSVSHKWATINKEDLQGERSYSSFHVERQSQLANAMFTKEIASRLNGTGVTANYVHPGAVQTDIVRYRAQWLIVPTMFLARPFLKTPKSGAQTTLTVALDPDLKDVTGCYFDDCKIQADSNNMKDDNTVKWLWKESERLTGLPQNEHN